MTLAVELGEGFSDDTVTLLVDGEEVWRRTGVTTNYSVGLADVARIPADPESTVEVHVRRMAQSFRWEPDAKNTTDLRTDISPDGELILGPAPGGLVY